MDEREHQVDDAARELPLGVRVAAAWSWRLIVIGLALAGALWLIIQVRLIVIPLLIAILLTALLSPIVKWFTRVGLPRWLGVITALASFGLSLYVLIWLIVTQLRAGFGDFAHRSREAWGEFLNWLGHLPFDVPREQLDQIYAQVMAALQGRQADIWSGALGVATTAGQVVAGALLTMFALIFLLIDGRRIWFWVLGFFPRKAHAPLEAAGRSGWLSVGQYVRVQVFVAFVDAVGIGAGAALLGVPMAVPIAILVFLASFIPFLGAIATGVLASFIALAYNGPINALLMLGVVILVNQIEGHVLQPLVMGTAVRVHPLGVVFAVSAGAMLAGIPGALFAVPIAASANSIVNTLVKKEWDPGSDPVAEFHKKYQTNQTAKKRARLITRALRRARRGKEES